MDENNFIKYWKTWERITLNYNHLDFEDKWYSHRSLVKTPRVRWLFWNATCQRGSTRQPGKSMNSCSCTVALVPRASTSPMTQFSFWMRLTQCRCPISTERSAHHATRTTYMQHLDTFDGYRSLWSAFASSFYSSPSSTIGPPSSPFTCTFYKSLSWRLVCLLTGGLSRPKISSPGTFWHSRCFILTSCRQYHAPWSSR